MKPWMIGVLAFGGGALTASGAWTAFPPSRTQPPAAPVSAAPEAKDESGLANANANLTSALHECDRRLAELGEHPVGTPAASAPAPAESAARGRRRDRGGALTK